MAFQTAVEVQEAVSAAPKGTQIEVARHGNVAIMAGANGYKRGFAMTVVAADGSTYAVCGCTRAKDVNIDIMVAKARAYADKFIEVKS